MLKLIVGGFELGIGVLPIFIIPESPILNPQSPILKTPIPISKSPICIFHQWVISIFSSLLKSTDNYVGIFKKEELNPEVFLISP